MLIHLELPLTFILAQMEFYGVKVDVNCLQNMGREFTAQLQQIEQRIYELAGTTFNINSPKQLGTILFEKLQLPIVKKRKQVIPHRRMF